MVILVLYVSITLWSISLKADKRKYTSFAHHNTQYAFKRMAMGLNNAAAIFSKILQNDLSQFHHDYAKIFLYVDDILIIVPEKYAIDVLDKFLCWLQARHYVIGLNKLQLFKQEISYLGYILNKDGLRTQTKKCKHYKI